MSYLVLLRHGESEWNALGLWTGKTDVPLTEKGRAEARAAAEHLRDLPLHVCHCSVLGRARETLLEIKSCLNAHHLPTVEHEALNERDYGELTGKNKWEVRDAWGEEKFHLFRRGWAHPVPGGETLKDVHARVVPYFERQIRPQLIAEQNVLVCFHGNSMRALVKHLDEIDDASIASLEIATSEIYLYSFDAEGKIKTKEIRYGQRV